MMASSNYFNGDLVTDVEGQNAQVTVTGTTLTDTVHLDAEVSVDTAFMLIDKSDTTTWPHTVSTGYHVMLEYIVIEVDPDTNYLGEVKLGYLKNVDATNGDFVQILDVDLRSKSDLIVENINFGNRGLQLSDATHFGPVIANSTLFQTDVNLGGPDDPTTLTYPSGEGDLILYITRSAGTVDVSITLGYEMVPN